ncbi:MAG: fasciclin domain-containing protein [Sumerlaeia bacterium]
MTNRALAATILLTGLAAFPAAGGAQTTETARLETDDAPSTRTVYSLLTTNPSLERFSGMLRDRGVLSLMTPDKSYTVFAPSNQAFEELTDDLERRLQDDNEMLDSILKYHIVAEEPIPTNSVGLDTIQGSQLAIGMHVVVNGEVAQERIEADDGVIYVLDAVLMPPSSLNRLTEDGEADTGRTTATETMENPVVQKALESQEPAVATPEPTPKLSEILANRKDYSTFNRILRASGIEEALASKGPFTVFAPINEAFQHLDEGELVDLLSNSAALQQTVLFHVAPDRYALQDLAKLENVQTLQGQQLAIGTSEAGLMIGNALVVRSDVKAENGVLHAIDRLLLPNLPKSEALEEAAQPDTN